MAISCQFTVTTVNAKGETIVRQRRQDVRTTHQYYGPWEVTSGAENSTRLHTAYGYYDYAAGAHRWYLRNRQGSVMAVTDGNGNVLQRSGVYPGGTPFSVDYNAEATPSLTAATDRLHIGNSWMSHSGLNWYDNTARMHDPLLMRFTTPDALATDYPSLSPWAHCAGNPANLTDPDGNDVRISVENQNITIDANIILTGDKATNELAQTYKEDIMSKWGEIKAINYKGNTYNVNWNVNVRVMGADEERVYNGINNYMEIVDGSNKSNVSPEMNRGQLRSKGREGRNLKDDCPMSHEFGHILGISDKYVTKRGHPRYGKPIDPKWKDDIMALPTYQKSDITTGTLTILFKGVLDTNLLGRYINKYLPSIGKILNPKNKTTVYRNKQNREPRK